LELHQKKEIAAMRIWEDPKRLATKKYDKLIFETSIIKVL
jgi:hypothetical protein